MRTARWLQPFLLLLFSLPYLLFLAYMLSSGSTPVDYSDFMRIGRSLLEGQFAYRPNVYYPLPTITIFALFAALPQALSVVLWFALPVLLALWITRWDPLVLLFAPLLSHFFGGQASIFGLIGFWGILHYRQSWKGGSLLAVSLLKPQLALIPVVYSVWGWVNAWLDTRKIPAPLTAFGLTALALAAPAFILDPGWLADWLANPRPVFLRALSGIAPRALAQVFSPSQPWFWASLSIAAVVVFWVLFVLNKKCFSLELVMLWNFIVSPLVHDYDLIQLVPLLKNRFVRRAALLASAPAWYVLIAKYQDDRAWFAFALIGPALAAGWLLADGDPQAD